MATARERRIAAFRLAHPGWPVPPGAEVARRATAAQRKEIEALVERHQAAIARLGESEMRALLPVFEQAKKELRLQLRRWIVRHPGDGELRWTAQSYHSALLHIDHGTAQLEQALFGKLKDSTLRAQKFAVAHLTEQVARFSNIFEGTARSLPLNAVKEIATARSFIISRIRSSAHRYAWSQKTGVAHDIQQRLAVDILKGEPVYNTIQRLIRDGGPRGAVSLRGVAGEEGSIVEYIPEGLFARYEHWAERIVRTETTSAYGAQSQASLQEASATIPDLKRMWMPDASACAGICAPMAGQIVGINEPFRTPMNDDVMFGGAHPNCGCCAVPWKADWNF